MLESWTQERDGWREDRMEGDKGKEKDGVNWRETDAKYPARERIRIRMERELEGRREAVRAGLEQETRRKVGLRLSSSKMGCQRPSKKSHLLKR